MDTNGADDMWALGLKDYLVYIYIYIARIDHLDTVEDFSISVTDDDAYDAHAFNLETQETTIITCTWEDIS